MKHLFLFIIISLGLISCQKKDTVTVELKVKAAKGPVFVTGNDSLLGGWIPDKVELTKEGDYFEGEFEFKPNTIIEFKFTRGSWDTEAVNSDGDVPRNYTFKTRNDTVAEYEITNWRDEFDYEDIIQGQVTGKLDYYDNMSYPGIRDRNVIVWTPPGYEKGNKRYPVLYMHDGQNIMDPRTSAFRIDWQVDEAADSLISKGEIEPFIIVGMYNTADRSADYSYTDTGYVYMDFIVKKLKPFIDKKYRTKPGRKYTATGGSSMGGLISFMLLWEHNETFSKAICMSPAFKIRQLDYVERIKDYKGKRKEFFAYIDNGGIALEEELQVGIDSMMVFLDSKGYKVGKDIEYVIDKEAEHNEPAWALRIPHAFRVLYGKK